MKKYSRTLIGAVAAIATFAMLTAFVGEKNMHQRPHANHMHQRHCTHSHYWAPQYK